MQNTRIIFRLIALVSLAFGVTHVANFIGAPTSIHPSAPIMSAVFYVHLR